MPCKPTNLSSHLYLPLLVLQVDPKVLSIFEPWCNLETVPWNIFTGQTGGHKPVWPCTHALPQGSIQKSDLQVFGMFQLDIARLQHQGKLLLIGDLSNIQGNSRETQWSPSCVSSLISSLVSCFPFLRRIRLALVGGWSALDGLGDSQGCWCLVVWMRDWAPFHLQTPKVWVFSIS